MLWGCCPRPVAYNNCKFRCPRFLLSWAVRPVRMHLVPSGHNLKIRTQWRAEGFFPPLWHWVMGLWALAGGLNNLWYSNITAHRMNDALQCLCWGVINVLTINNNYQKNKRPYAWPEDFHPKSLFFFLVWKYWGFSSGLGHVRHGEMEKTCMQLCMHARMHVHTYTSMYMCTKAHKHDEHRHILGAKIHIHLTHTWRCN